MGLREETGGKRENKAWEEEVAALAIPNRKPFMQSQDQHAAHCQNGTKRAVEKGMAAR